MRWVLLHSPFTGPTVWRPVALEAARRGLDATVPTIPELRLVSAPYYPEIARHVATQIAGDGPAALIVHSGAGGLVPSILEAADGRFGQVVFVDAILPYPGRTWISTAGDAFAENLRAKFADGFAPAWDGWFPPGALASLVNDHTLRRAFVRELRPTPVAFMEECAPPADHLDGVGWSYLRLSEAYEPEARAARHRGRLTLRRNLHHLSPMTHPREVVSSLMNLIRG